MNRPAGKTVRKKPAAPKRPAAKGSRKKPPKKKQLHPLWVAGGLLILALVVLVPHWISRSLSTGAVVPAGYRQVVLDLSHHNARHVQWDSLRVFIDAEGRSCRDIRSARTILPLTAVVLKATEGESFLDPNYAQWWAEAGEAGLRRGAYHFFRSSRDAQLQAQSFIGTVSLSYKDLPPVLDVETVHEGCTREQLNRKLLQWLEMVEAHYGRKPIVYTSDSFVRDWLLPAVKDEYPLWIARYNAEPPRREGWLFWQFTDRAVVHGISGRTDLSVVSPGALL